MGAVSKRREEESKGRVREEGTRISTSSMRTQRTRRNGAGKAKERTHFKGILDNLGRLCGTDKKGGFGVFDDFWGAGFEGALCPLVFWLDDAEHDGGGCVRERALLGGSEENKVRYQYTGIMSRITIGT